MAELVQQPVHDQLASYLCGFKPAQEDMQGFV